jgi:hypothetical protein
MGPAPEDAGNVTMGIDGIMHERQGRRDTPVDNTTEPFTDANADFIGGVTAG